VPTPIVSHKTWVYTRAYARFCIASETIEIDKLSFNDWVERILTADIPGAMEQIEKDGAHEYSHAFWEEGKTITVFPYADSDHRPSVEASTVALLDEQVHEQYGINPDSLGFEDKLKLILELAEEYYEKLDLYVQTQQLNV
jgi:hypothetical protein